MLLVGLQMFAQLIELIDCWISRKFFYLEIRSEKAACETDALLFTSDTEWTCFIFLIIPYFFTWNIFVWFKFKWALLSFCYVETYEEMKCHASQDHGATYKKEISIL